MILLIRIDCLGYFHLAPPLFCWLVLGPYLQMGLILGLPNEMCNNFNGIPKIRYRHETSHFRQAKIDYLGWWNLQFKRLSAIS